MQYYSDPAWANFVTVNFGSPPLNLMDDDWSHPAPLFLEALSFPRASCSVCGQLFGHISDTGVPKYDLVVNERVISVFYWRLQVVAASSDSFLRSWEKVVT